MAPEKREFYSDTQAVLSAKKLGYQNWRPDAGVKAHNAGQLFRGTFKTTTLLSGIQFWVSDLTAACDLSQEAVLEKAVRLRVTLAPGNASMQLGNKSVVAKPGELIRIAFNDDVGGKSYSKGNQRHLCVGLNIDPSKIADDQIASLVERMMVNDMFDARPATMAVAALANDLCGSGRDIVDPIFWIKAESWSMLAITDCLEVQQTQIRLLGHEVRGLERAREYAEANLGAKLSLQDLAREAGMGLTLFKERYRQRFGETPFQTIRQARLRLAYSSLKSGEVTIAQAAHLAGYRHIGSFSDAYLKAFGSRPSTHS